MLLLEIKVRLADISDIFERDVNDKHTYFVSLLQRSMSIHRSSEAISSNWNVAVTEDSMTDCSITEPPRLHSALASAKNGDSSFRGYRDHDTTLQGLFVYPPKKFAFCLIEKNACSTWIETVFQQLMREHDWSPWLESVLQTHGFIRTDYNISWASQAKFGEQGIESIFQDPSATRAVFVREPLERFASAFLNKCIHTNLYYCPVKSAVFRDVVEWALQADLSSTDGHFMPQAYHCDLQRRISQYNVIGLMKEDSLNKDMDCVLSKAGLHDFVGQAPSHVNQRHRALNATSVLQKLFTPAAARQLIERLHVDYDLFGFSKAPDWIDGATGEWYSKDPTKDLSLLQDDHHAGPSTERRVHEDRNDLAELAFRAGYTA